jgi:DNA-binding response OmpR family regulator
MDHTPRILVVDDAPDVQLLARRALEGSFQVVPAGTLGEAESVLSQGGIDLVILDVQLPDGSGFDFCRKLSQSKENARVPVILLTSLDEVDAKIRGFSAGAEDYIVKPFHPAELEARAQLRLRGRSPASASGNASAGETRIGDIEFHPQGDRVTIDTSIGKAGVSLTKREYRLLLCLARAGGRILTREEIILQVWEHDSRITGRTVDTHICKLRKKIGNSRFTIHSVYGAGYRFVEPADAFSPA